MAVIGVGQIGGSVALGARVAGAVTEVVAWSRTRDKLERAQALGIIDRAARSTAEAARGAAVVVLATPVRSLGEAAAAIARELDEGALVFDVGSVKAAAIASVEPKLRPGAYVPCHPIAGTERVGPDAASPLLFEGKRCVICPTPRSNEQAVATVERLWTSLGAEPVRMTAQLHDRVFGAGSHLPHVAAAVADVQPARHDARRRVEPGDVARHLPRQPIRGAAADRRAGELRARAARRGGGRRRGPDREAARRGQGGPRSRRRRVTPR